MSIAERLARAWEKHTELITSRGKPQPRTYCYASGWWPCTRRMAMDCLYPSGITDIRALERISRGDEYEVMIRTRLERAGLSDGYRVVGTQEHFTLKDREGNQILSGRTDGRIVYETGQSAVLEIKAGSGVSNVCCASDFERSIWNKKKLRQLLIYQLGLGEERGVFVTETYGAPRFILVKLRDWLEQADQFLEAATIASAAARHETPLPGRTESTMCERCDHRGACAPSIGSAAAADYSDDEELIRAARTIVELGPAAKQYNQAKELIKARFHGSELAVIGPYTLTGRWKPGTRYSIPDEIKARYRETDEHYSWVPTIESNEVADE